VIACFFKREKLDRAVGGTQNPLGMSLTQHRRSTLKVFN
jgi:hypothetical protein